MNRIVYKVFIYSLICLCLVLSAEASGVNNRRAFLDNITASAEKHYVFNSVDGRISAIGGDGTTYGLEEKEYNDGEVTYLSPDNKFLKVCAGEYSTVAVGSDGYIWYWGSCLSGKFGHSHPTGSTVYRHISPVKHKISSIGNEFHQDEVDHTIIDIVASEKYTVYLMDDGCLLYHGRLPGDNGTMNTFHELKQYCTSARIISFKDENFAIVFDNNEIEFRIDGWRNNFEIDVDEILDVSVGAEHSAVLCKNNDNIEVYSYARYNMYNQYGIDAPYSELQDVLLKTIEVPYDENKKYELFTGDYYTILSIGDENGFKYYAWGTDFRVMDKETKAYELMTAKTPFRYTSECRLLDIGDTADVYLDYVNESVIICESENSSSYSVSSLFSPLSGDADSNGNGDCEDTYGSSVYLRGVNNDQYSGFLSTYVYGYEKNSEVPLGLGTLKNASEDFLSASQKYVTAGKKAIYFRMDGYDEKSGNFTELVDLPKLKVKITRPASAGGNGSMLGANYSIYHFENGEMTQLEIVDCDLYEVEFLTDDLGYFVLIYNDDVLDFAFMLDENTVYKKIENLSVKDTIELPKAPIKEGFIFDGWYFYTSNPMYTQNLEDGMQLSEITSGKAFARWIKDITNADFDVNNDGLLNLQDVNIIINAIAGIDSSDYEIIKVDFNGDNKITIYDLNQLLMYMRKDFEVNQL